MSVFALENGRLVPAHAVNAGDAGVTAESLAAIRERVVELIDVPLFPVAWQSEPAGEGSKESLIALDPAGQTVTVEVLNVLNADELLGALARAGRHSEMGRSSLALIYGPGARSFPRDWHMFLDACPPHPSPGPRLYLVVLGIDENVKSAVDALAGSGLDVRKASLHDGGSQVLVSFEEVRPRPARLSAILSSPQHANELLLSESPSAVSPVAESPVVVSPAESAISPAEATFEDFDASAGAADPDTAEYVTGAEPVVEPEPTIEAETSVEAEAAEVSEAAPNSVVPVPEPEIVGQPAPVERADPAVETEEDAEPVEAAEPVETETSAPVVSSPVVSTPEMAPTSTSDQISQLRALLAGDEEAAAPIQNPTERKAPRRAHGRRAVSRERSAAESGPDRPVRLDRPERGTAPSAFANVPGYAGPSAFAQSAASQSDHGNRAEQDLWENSAPKSSGRRAPQIISESAAATSSSEAVEEAAQLDHTQPAQGQQPSRLLQIAQRYGAPFNVVWSQRRRNISLSARVTARGTMALSDGRVFTDPSEAASAASGIAGVDGWSVWKVPGGKRLGDL
ncbi:MAG: hypothetical protein ACTHW1_06950 [Ancrocorticia sp.]|uniref:restriction system modified-DNA reader domain-containing protein n=1 Tax=Ancrocorticia sp. TaxID=2593684 RepID=UPI003F901F90